MTFDLQILAVGKRMPAWVDEAVQDYLPRFTHPMHCEIIPVQAVSVNKSMPAAQAVEKEGQRLLSLIQPKATVIALEVTGNLLSTEKLVDKLSSWMATSTCMQFLIGGANGLSSACLRRATTKWSLSPLTFPHHLARVMVIEQLYRACSFKANHPYHRP